MHDYHYSFSIDRATDPDRQFAVDDTGQVTVARPLDRETVPVHRIHILAIDQGTPAQTGTGTLILTLEDVNDNYPVFAEDYRPVIYEEEPPRSIVIINGQDKDTLTNGPPFTMWVPCDGACPCVENPSCADFEFIFTPGML